MPITPDQQTRRFAENEQRVDQWVNSETGYTASTGEQVESILALKQRLERSAFLFLTGPVFINERTITEDITVPNGKSGMAISPIIAEGVTLTVEPGGVFIAL